MRMHTNARQTKVLMYGAVLLRTVPRIIEGGKIKKILKSASLNVLRQLCIYIMKK